MATKKHYIAPYSLFQASRESTALDICQLLKNAGCRDAEGFLAVSGAFRTGFVACAQIVVGAQLAEEYSGELDLAEASRLAKAMYHAFTAGESGETRYEITPEELAHDFAHLKFESAAKIIRQMNAAYLGGKNPDFGLPGDQPAQS